MKCFSLPEATCQQAVINTQLVDGFMVKITKDQHESAAFLTIMTRYLQSKYQVGFYKTCDLLIHHNYELLIL